MRTGRTRAIVCVPFIVAVTVIVIVAVTITTMKYVQGTVQCNSVQHMAVQYIARCTMHDRPALPIHWYNIAI